MHSLNDELRNFDVWLKCYKLSINLQKNNNYIIFKSRQKKLNYNFTLFFGNHSLNQANMTKFLGVYVDELLTWKHHISLTRKQISKSVNIIFRSRFYLFSKTIKLTLYYALIYPYITHCNSTCSSTYVSNLNRIFYLQKRVVRALSIQIIEHTLLLYLLNWVSYIFKLLHFK